MEERRGYIIVDGERYETLNGKPHQEDPSEILDLKDDEDLTEDKIPF